MTENELKRCREEFEAHSRQWRKDNPRGIYYAFHAWTHQQKRINELEKELKLSKHKFDLSDCPVVEARPCSKYTHQSALLAKAVEALEIARDTIGKPLKRQLDPSEVVQINCKVSGYVVHTIESALAQLKNYQPQTITNKENIMLTNQQLEEKLEQSPAPRVTVEQMQSRIKEVTYHKIGSTVTLCNIELDNGYSVRGESACVNPANYNEEIGNKIAYDNAFRQLWALFGFLLAESNFTNN